jgi:hypothetical protein
MIGRAVLLAATAVALLPPVATAAISGDPGYADTRGDEPRFQPPAGPMVLTRTLWRSLRDGRQIMVRRRYAVAFVASGEGYRLDGRQLDVTVDAPAQLGALAELERARVDDGMFPLHLSARGWITGGPATGNAPDSATRDALDLSLALVRTSGLSAGSKQEAAAQLEQLMTASTGQWPADLFSPSAKDRAIRRVMTVPGSSGGEIEVSIRYLRSGANPLPIRAERTVTTIIEGGTRVSREVWTLDPAPHP